MESVVFVIAGVIVLGGGLGVVLNTHPVHCALSLVATLFGVAVLFVAQDAPFLAAVQIIVYAGAIVVLFLFVIMLLGVDRSESLATEPLTGQRPAALIAGALLGAGLVAVLATATITGAPGSESMAERAAPNVTRLAKAVFTSDLFAFEVTSVLLVIAVVGAVVLAHHRAEEVVDADEPVIELGFSGPEDRGGADTDDAATHGEIGAAAVAAGRDGTP